MRRDLYKDLYDLEDKHWWHISKRKTISKLIEKFSIKKNVNILDIGCGTGLNMESYSKFGKTYGIDISEKAIWYCKKRGLKNVEVGSCYKTNFKQNMFDVVSLLDVLEHIEEKKGLLEIRRILKQKGIVIINVPAYQFLWSKWDEVLHHKRRYTKKRLISVLKNEGFEIKFISYHFSLLVLVVYLVRFVKKITFGENYPSDFKLSNNYINLLFEKIFDLERIFVLNFSVPFGTSLVCVAKKTN